MAPRPKSTKYLNSKWKPSAKGKVAPDIKVGDKFDNAGAIFVVTGIDPESNLPYAIEYLNLGYPSLGRYTYTTIKSCKRV